MKMESRSVKAILRLWLCILALGLSAPASSSASSFPDRYDREIRKAVKNWLPGVDWILLKAQYYQESLLDPDAISPVGARGIAQMMPGTWEEISQAMKWGGISPHDAEFAVEAGAFYMRRMRKGWSSPRPERDRHDLALASYNAGFGNLLKAQRHCGMPIEYPEIAECLPDITGHHSKETLTYVTRTRKWHTMMTLDD